MSRFALMAVLVAALAATTVAVLASRQAQVELKVGDMAPGFSLPGSDGRTHTLAEYTGRAVVVAWFPKAFTGG
jgi:peroxiredoxin Q/BCP